MNLLDPLAWAVLLMLLGGGLALSEVFIPSGGILGLLSVTAIGASVFMAFNYYGPGVGLLFGAIAVIGIPVSLALAFKYWPQTALGKRFLQAPPPGDEVLPDNQQRRQLKALVGKIGKAKCDMLPAGAIFIEGMLVDAITQGMPVDEGQMVKVVEVRANRIVVRPLEDGEHLSERDPNDVLSQPLESLGLESWDEPLA